MASTPVIELKRKSDAAAANLSKQLQGMEPLLDKSDAAEEWTTRQVLCHLLGDPDWKPVAMLKSFTSSNLPVITLAVYVGAMFDYHWNDHAGQIAKIRKANGMPDA